MANDDPYVSGSFETPGDTFRINDAGQVVFTCQVDPLSGDDINGVFRATPGQTSPDPPTPLAGA